MFAQKKLGTHNFFHVGLHLFQTLKKRSLILSFFFFLIVIHFLSHTGVHDETRIFDINISDREFDCCTFFFFQLTTVRVLVIVLLQNQNALLVGYVTEVIHNVGLALDKLATMLLRLYCFPKSFYFRCLHGLILYSL